MPPRLLETVLTILRALDEGLIPSPPVVPKPAAPTQLIAPPRTSRRPRGSNPKVLAQVRALPGEGPSGRPYPRRQKALSAKAQDLMNQCRLEQVEIIEGKRRAGRRPSCKYERISLDPPYVQPKTLLVQAVARANRSSRWR